MSTNDKIKTLSFGMQIINPLELSNFIRFWDSKVLSSNSNNDITIDEKIENAKSVDDLSLPIHIEQSKQNNHHYNNLRINEMPHSEVNEQDEKT